MKESNFEMMVMRNKSIEDDPTNMNTTLGLG